MNNNAMVPSMMLAVIMAMSIMLATVSTAIVGETTFIHMLMRGTNPIPIYINYGIPRPHRHD